MSQPPPVPRTRLTLCPARSWPPQEVLEPLPPEGWWINFPGPSSGMTQVWIPPGSLSFRSRTELPSTVVVGVCAPALELVLALSPGLLLGFPC